jgi:hypothetical protein
LSAFISSIWQLGEGSIVDKSLFHSLTRFWSRDGRESASKNVANCQKLAAQAVPFAGEKQFPAAQEGRFQLLDCGGWIGCIHDLGLNEFRQ